MKLKDELGRNNDFLNIDIEIMVSTAYLSKNIDRASMDFFGQFEIKQGDKVYNVTDMQFNALVVLNDRMGQETLQTELAEQLLINKSSAGTLIDKLESREWISRIAKDRRANFINITENGLRVLETVAPVFDAACTGVIESFTEKEKEQFLDYINRYRNLIKTFNK